jgi:hypothetical protein
MHIGTKALESGSRMGLNVVFAHEAYRNGKDDGEEGQRTETDRAVEGHVDAALALIAGYGAGSVGGEFGAEAKKFNEAYWNKDMEAISEIVDQYDSSADYLLRVQRDDGTYGVIKDGNHSLLDEDGNVLIRSPLDIFDKNDKIIGHEVTDEDSYKRSFGMLMGMYSDFTGRTYEEYKAYVSTFEGDDAETEKRKAYDSMILSGITKAMGKTLEYTMRDGTQKASIGVNAYLMTLVGVVSGEGIRHSVREMYDGSTNLITFINIKDKKGEVVGTIGGSFIQSSSRADETDYIMIENMIPEGRRLKAATFQLTSDGSVAMFGLGSTMPDPNNMGAKLPALADGTYRQVTSLHSLYENSYKALRLFDAVAGKNATAGDVIGSNRATTAVPGFPYGTGDWNKYRQNLTGYNYDAEGNRVEGKASDINVHMSNNNPFIASDSGNYGGSEGCMLWHPSTYDRILGNQSYGTFGNFTINRSFFGDGTGGKNNYLNW